MHERKEFDSVKRNNEMSEWHQRSRLRILEHQWFEKRLISDESFNQKRKIKLLHVKIKKLENLVVQTILVEVHILILVNDLKSIANFENDHQLNFISLVYTFQTKVKVAFMIDMKVSKRTFINRRYVKFYKFFIVRLQKSIKLRLTDDKLILNIIYMIQLTFSLNDHIDTCWCMITNLSK